MSTEDCVIQVVNALGFNTLFSYTVDKIRSYDFKSKDAVPQIFLERDHHLSFEGVTKSVEVEIRSLWKRYYITEPKELGDLSLKDIKYIYDNYHDPADIRWYLCDEGITDSNQYIRIRSEMSAKGINYAIETPIYSSDVLNFTKHPTGRTDYYYLVPCSKPIYDSTERTTKVKAIDVMPVYACYRDESHYRKRFANTDNLRTLIRSLEWMVKHKCDKLLSVDDLKIMISAGKTLLSE